MRTTRLAGRFERGWVLAGSEICLLGLLAGCLGEAPSAVYEGPYFGLERPSTTAQVFAPGIISFGFHEHKLTASPQGSEFFYVMSDSSARHYAMVRVSSDEGRWMSPEIAPFSSNYNDISPAFSPDGKRLFFSSDRPYEGSENSIGSQDIWYSVTESGQWSEPYLVRLSDRQEYREINPSVGSDGTLYFQADYDGGWDIYRSSLVDGEYGPPVKVGYPVSTEHNEGGPCISADGTSLLFHSSRSGGFGQSDIYVCFKDDGGNWGEAINLGDTVNSAASDTGPFLSFDGAYIFFSSFRSLDPSELKGKSYKELIGLYR